MGHPAASKVETPGNGNYNLRVPRQGRPELAAVGGYLKGLVPANPPQTTLINKYKGNTFPREPASLARPLTSLSGCFLQPRGLYFSAGPHQRLQKLPGGVCMAPGPARRTLPERCRTTPVPAAACPCRHRASSRRVLLSSAAPSDSQPGHTELIWLQVCSLTKTARFSHDISPPSCRLAAPFLPLAGNRQPLALPGSGAGTAAAPRRLPQRYRLPWNAVIPLAPGEMRAEEVPAVRPGPWLLLKVHLLGLLQSLLQPSGH